MVYRELGGRVVQLGAVSGTDQTPIGLYEPTAAQRIFLENPIFVPNFEQTVINSTASGAGVQIVGEGIIGVDTSGLTITVSGPEITDIEGADVDSINTLTGTVTIEGQNNATAITSVPQNTIFVDVPFDDDDVDDINTITGSVTLAAGNNTSVQTDLPSKTITINSFTDDDIDSITVSGTTITGSVEFVGTNSVSLSVSGDQIAISGSGVSSMGFEDDGIVYINDPTRSNKRLSLHRQHFPFNRNGTADNTYLRLGDMLNNESGWVMPRDATITAWTVFYADGGAGTKGFEIRVNDVAVALASATVVQGWPTVQKNLNIDIDEGDRLQVFVVAAGATASDSNSSIEVAWRK